MGVWYPAMQYPISASGENLLIMGFSVNTHKQHFIVYQAFLCTLFHLLFWKILRDSSCSNPHVTDGETEAQKG